MRKPQTLLYKKSLCKLYIVSEIPAFLHVQGQKGGSQNQCMGELAKGKS